MTAPGPYLPAVLPALRQAYGSPGRHYHNLQHIHDCLREFEPVRNLCEAPDAVELAIWFHDCVYDAAGNDNEERSAAAADSELKALGAPPELVRRVGQLILATRHDSSPTDPDAKLLVDIDLAILGRPRDEFDRYEAAIRLEYSHVPDDAFAKGRSAVLRRFIGRPRIYQTPWFHEKYETAARKNLARSLSALESGGITRPAP